MKRKINIDLAMVASQPSERWFMTIWYYVRTKVSQDDALALLKVVVPRELDKSSCLIVLRLLYYFTWSVHYCPMVLVTDCEQHVTLA